MTGFCTVCGVILKNDEKPRCEYCTWRSRNDHKKRRTKIRLLVFTHYSQGVPKCNCCGETNILFLTLDHVNNDGYKERKNNKYIGNRWYEDVIKKGFPSGLQVLCSNCNTGKMRNEGICPHIGIVEKKYPEFEHRLKKSIRGKGFCQGFSLYFNKISKKWIVQTVKPQKYFGSYDTKLKAATVAIEITKKLFPENVGIVWERLAKQGWDTPKT